MSNPNDQNNQEEETKVENQPEVKDENPETKVENKQETNPEPKTEKKPAKTKEDNLKYFKEKWQNSEGEKEQLSKRISEIEKSLEEEKLGRKKTEIQNKALEMGLNPKQKAVFEKYHLDHIVSSEDLESALNNVKTEVPYLFQEPPKNLAGNVPGGKNIQAKEVDKMSLFEFAKHRLNNNN